MVTTKILFTLLGLCVVCIKTAPGNPSLINKLLTQPGDRGIKIPVRKAANDGSTQKHFDGTASQRTNEETISRIFKGMLLKERLKTININGKRSSLIGSTKDNSEDISSVQVSPNVHSDYLHIENYVPTFISIPCNSRSCDSQSYAYVNCQTLSDIVKSNIPSNNFILCPQYAPTHNVAGDNSYAPNVIAISSPTTESFVSNINDEIASLHISNDNLSDIEFSEVLQSEISNSPLIETEHLSTPELPTLPISHSHPEFHETYIVNDAINADHISDNEKFSEFTSYPQLSITTNDEVITPETETNPSLSHPSPFEYTVYLPMPEPPAYFPLNPAYTETVNHSEEIVSLLEPHEPSNAIIIPESRPSTFENQPIIVIPEAPLLMPLNPPNISHAFSRENTTAGELTHAIYSDYSEIPHPETTSHRGDIIESTYTSDIPTNVALNAAYPTEPTFLIPEPPIYFPLKPSFTNDVGQSEDREIISLLDNYESSYTISIPENTPSSLNSLPNITIPEAPELMPLNSINLTFDSTSEKILSHEATQAVLANYSDPYHIEKTTVSKEIIENTPTAVIPPAPVLLPLNPPNTATFTASDTHTIDHAHSITLEDSPYLLISHFLNTQNNTTLDTSESSTFSPDFEINPSQNQWIEIPDAPELTTLKQPNPPILSSDIYFDNEENNDEVIYYDNQKEGLSVDYNKIPEAPLLLPLNPPFTSPPLNSNIPLHSIENASIQDENSVNTNEVLALSLKPQTSTLESDVTKDEQFEISEVPTTKPPTNPTFEGSELSPESTPLNIMLSMNQQITLPQVLHNSNLLFVSNNHNEIRGQKEHMFFNSPGYSNPIHEDSPLSIEQDSSIIVASSPITVEKTNEVASQLDLTMQKLKLNDTEKQMQQNFKDLPPCESETPTDGVVTNAFEPKKCRQEVKEGRKTNSSSKQSISKRSRRRKVVVRNHKRKQTNVTENKI